MKYPPGWNHSGRRWVSWGALYHRFNANLHCIRKYTYISNANLPRSRPRRRVESSTPFPPFETKLLPNASLMHLRILATMTKTKSIWTFWLHLHLQRRVQTLFARGPFWLYLQSQRRGNDRKHVGHRTPFFGRDKPDEKKDQSAGTNGWKYPLF